MVSRYLLASVLVVTVLAVNIHAEDSAEQVLDRIRIYHGTCRNVTAGLDGFVKLAMERDGDRFSGCISITGYLVGSGDISGELSGSRVRFESHDPVQDLRIAWQARSKDEKLVGEYVVQPSADGLVPRQVGEWEVAPVTEEGSATSRKDLLTQLVVLQIESNLNAPVANEAGGTSSDAQLLFDSIHPVGTALNVAVTGIDIDWHDDDPQGFDDVWRFTADLALFWTGPMVKQGRTDVRLSYNAEIQSFTGLELVATNGKTYDDLANASKAVVRFAGKAALRFLTGE